MHKVTSIQVWKICLTHGLRQLEIVNLLDLSTSDQNRKRMNDDTVEFGRTTYVGAKQCQHLDVDIMISPSHKKKQQLDLSCNCYIANNNMLPMANTNIPLDLLYRIKTEEPYSLPLRDEWY